MVKYNKIVFEGGVVLRRFLLIVLLIGNVFYITNFLSNYDTFKLNILWVIFFSISLYLSILFLTRSRKKSGYNPYLSISVLVTSISCLGSFVFLYFVTNLMG